MTEQSEGTDKHSTFLYLGVKQDDNGATFIIANAPARLVRPTRPSPPR